MFNRKSIRRLVGAVALCCGFSAHAYLEISPVKIELSQKQPIASLSLKNHKDVAVLIQSEVLSWDIVDGQDVYAPTDEVLFNPPVFELAPGKTQVLRIGLAHPGPLDTQRTYRIFVQEVPDANPDAGGLRVALQFSVPVLAQPSVVHERDLAADQPSLQADTLKFRVTNAGNTVSIVRSVRVLNAETQKEIGHQPALAYVLAGKSAELSVKLSDPARPRRILVVMDTPRGMQHAQFDFPKR